MWAPAACLLLSSLSLSWSDQQSPLRNSSAQVLGVQNVTNEVQCQQLCRDSNPTGGNRTGQLFCRWSPKEPQLCVVLECPQLVLCQNASSQEIQELVAEFESHHGKLNFTTTETWLTLNASGTSPAPARQPTEPSQTPRPLPAARGNQTELGSSPPNGTSPGNSSLGPVSAATTDRPSATLTPQVQRTTEGVSTGPLLTQRTQAGSLPATQDHDGSRTTTAGVTVPEPKAANGSAGGSPSRALTTPSGGIPRQGTPTLTKAGSADVPSDPQVPATTPSLALPSSQTSAASFRSTPTLSTSTRAASSPKPEAAPSTPQATGLRTTPTAEPTSAARAAGTPGPSQAPESAPLPTGPRPVSPTVPEPSLETGTESQYVPIVTSPFAQYLVKKNLLLAVLFAGTLLFLAVLVLLAMQAYESYKKKDYTQVDYLINGMYADSEM
ncbi:uncharacterized protein C11orf24 homolog [Antechinus flavipes]|uniref:uncharacterized protein C11orf24 homolog n=1 Tax=Antechinus flavipes TaxID=38775 RepID=UPI002236392D|nr:uncharacterized protein C11orf24 homolog [Antechinus flavipes]XP_051819723.1 uncharacterized protein C11orf24 homolog [Antechinus flavipes]